MEDSFSQFVTAAVFLIGCIIALDYWGSIKLKRRCPHCTRMIPRGAKVCPVCHRDVKPPFSQKMSQFGSAVLIVMTLFLVFVVWLVAS